MPSEEGPRVQVEFTPDFKRNLRRLSRKYRRVRFDVTPLLKQLESGETPGDQIQGTGYRVFKVRVKNRDAQRGKSGSYRLIYYVQTPERVILVPIYSKSDQGNIAGTEIQQIIASYARG